MTFECCVLSDTHDNARPSMGLHLVTRISRGASPQREVPTLYKPF